MYSEDVADIVSLRQPNRCPLAPNWAYNSCHGKTWLVGAAAPPHLGGALS